VKYSKIARVVVGSTLLLSTHATQARAQLTPPAPLGPSSTPPGADGNLMNPSSQPTTVTPPPGAESLGVTPPPSSPMAAALDKAEAEDNGRSFELFWVRAEAGLSHINLASFSEQQLAIVNDKSTGGVFGAGVGFRFLLLTIGARARFHQLSAFNLWQVNAVVGASIPISSLDLSFTAHGGYSAVGKFSDSAFGGQAPNTPNPSGDVSVKGWNAGLGASLDYYITPSFSLGGGVTAEGLFLKRPPTPIPADTPPAVRAQIEQTDLYKNSGTSVGFGFTAGLRAGLHFGI
jgi:hypothetical protein